MTNTLRPRTRQQNKALATVGNRTANSTITTAPPRKKKRMEGERCLTQLCLHSIKPSTIRVTELRKIFEGGDKPHEDRGKPHENRDKLDEDRDKPASPFVDFRGVPSLKVNMKAKVPKVSKTCWRNGGDLIDSSQLEASGSCSHFFYALPKRTSFCRCKVICLFAAHESMLF